MSIVDIGIPAETASVCFHPWWRLVRGMMAVVVGACVMVRAVAVGACVVVLAFFGDGGRGMLFRY